jgi:hypothetical protein
MPLCRELRMSDDARTLPPSENMPNARLIVSVNAQDQLLIQRQLGDAIRGAWEALTLETLPD